MIDIKYVIENPDRIKEILKNRRMEHVDVDELLRTHKSYVDAVRNVETHRSIRNKLSEDISKVKEEERKKLIEEATTIKKEIVELEKELDLLDEKRTSLLKKLPNLVAEGVPIGPDESGNVVVRQVGELPKFDFTPLDHMELGTRLGLINTEVAADIVGARFAYILGDAARLQFSMVQFIFDTLTNPEIVAELAKKVGNPNLTPFIPVVPPVMIREEVMEKMDRLEPKDERYLLEKDGLVLVGSAEHTLGPMHMNTVFKEDNLPVRYIGYSTAFRREAGSYGKDTKGILRVHQFDKLEMESFCAPQHGMVEQDLFVAIQEYIVEKLELPYQVVQICTGDMGKPDYRQIDIECYIPSQEKYRETHTSDYMTDFQSRRLNIRYAEEGYVHMNDATALAIGRALIAILENHQQKDGTIRIPKSLQKYMGKEIIK